MNNKLDLSKIKQVDFPTNQYYREVYSKSQLVFHHTVSGKGVEGDINWWLQDLSRIATCCIIGHKGKIYQNFSSKYWAHHLGVKQYFLMKKGFIDFYKRNTFLNKHSISVEIDSWGALVNKMGVWYPVDYVGRVKPIPKEEVQLYPFGYRGYFGYQKYTDEQIESCRQLAIFWNENYEIPLDYNEGMWDVSMRALKGESGIWSHVSYRPDKSDCHPQPEFIQMLKELKNV